MSGVPYDAERIRTAVRDDSSRGCMVTVTDRDGTHRQCGRPVIAIRRWHALDGNPVVGRVGLYGGVCQEHAIHDVIPLNIVLSALGLPTGEKETA